MILVGAIVLGLLVQSETFSQAADKQTVARLEERVSTPASVPSAGTEVALRRLVAGLASGLPDYDKLSPRFADIVRQDLPTTQPLFSSMGQLESVTFRERGDMGDDVYDLVFANGKVLMSAALDADGRMVGGILQPVGTHGKPAAGTEAALRKLVAGLASGSPDYDKLSPGFAEVVRRDLPRTQPLFSSMGELRSVTFQGRGERGDDVYKLLFANGSIEMSAALDPDGRMIGGILQPIGTPRR